MTFTHDSARGWASAHSLSADVRFGRLEIIAFQRHPEIHRLFGDDGALYARIAADGRRSGAARVGAVLVAVLAVVGAAAPLAAIAVLGGDRFGFFELDAALAVPLAGSAYVLTAVTQVVVLIVWRRAGGWYDGLVIGIAAVAAVFSGLGLIAMPNIAVSSGTDGWGVWYPAAVVAFGAAILLLLAVRTRRDVRPPTATDPPAPAPGDPGPLIAALPAAEREAIRADREAALDTLRARGLIDDVARARAAATPLGALHTLDVPAAPA